MNIHTQPLGPLASDFKKQQQQKKKNDRKIDG